MIEFSNFHLLKNYKSSRNNEKQAVKIQNSMALEISRGLVLRAMELRYNLSIDFHKVVISVG